MDDQTTLQTPYGYTAVTVEELNPVAEEDALVGKLMQLFTSFRDSSSWVRGKWERNRRMFLYQGLGIPLDQELVQDTFDPLSEVGTRRRNPATSTPILYSTYEQLVADAIELIPEALFIGRERSDGILAQDMTAIFRALMERRNFRARYAEWVRIRSQYGMAIIETLWDRDEDDGDGDVDLNVWQPSDVYLDPLYENLQDGRAVFKVTHHHMGWFKEHYPDKYGKMNVSSGDMRLSDSLTHSHRDEELVALYECWCRIYDAKRRKYRIHMYKIAGGALLENSQSMKATKDGMYDHGQYPFIASYYEQIKGTPWGLGPLDYLAPMQEYISKMDDMILRNIIAAARPRMLVSRSADIDVNKLRDADEEIIEASRIDDGAVRWETGQPLNAYAIQMLLHKTDTLKMESGQNAASRGEVPGSVTAASAISMLQSAGSKRANLSQYGLNQSFAEVVRQMVGCMMQFYKKERVFRIRQPLQAQERVIVFDPAMFKTKPSSWAYDLEIRVQREATWGSGNINQLVMTFVQMGALRPIQACQLLDIPQKDVIAMAVEQNDTIQTTITQLMDRVKELEGETARKDDVLRGLVEQEPSPETIEQPAAIPPMEIPPVMEAPPIGAEMAFNG